MISKFHLSKSFKKTKLLHFIFLCVLTCSVSSLNGACFNETAFFKRTMTSHLHVPTHVPFFRPFQLPFTTLQLVAQRFCSTKPSEKCEAFKQCYTIPTYDQAFKKVLSDDIVRSSFFRSLIPRTIIPQEIISSMRIDEHMAPVQGLEALRSFFNIPNALQNVGFQGRDFVQK